jgi:hypothetical protein
MPNPTKRISGIAVAASLACGLIFAAPAAEASFVEVRDGNGGDVFSGGPGSQNLTINVGGGNLAVAAGAFALQYRLGGSGPWTDFLTYCLEADESLGLSGATPVTGTLNWDIASTAEYAAAADSLMRLYATWFEDSKLSSVKSAAFQVAVWELATDPTINLNGGTFKLVTGGAVATQANDYLNTGGWLPAADLGVILRVGNQDLLVETEGGTTPDAIPEPGTLTVLGLGLLGLAAARRRRRTQGLG